MVAEHMPVTMPMPLKPNTRLPPTHWQCTCIDEIHWPVKHSGILNLMWLQGLGLLTGECVSSVACNLDECYTPWGRLACPSSQMFRWPASPKFGWCRLGTWDQKGKVVNHTRSDEQAISNEYVSPVSKQSVSQWKPVSQWKLVTWTAKHQSSICLKSHSKAINLSNINQQIHST